MTTTARRAAATLAVTSLVVLAPWGADAATRHPFSKAFTDTCHLFDADHAVPARASGSIPTSVARGGAFWITGVRFSATIPASVATDAYRLGGRTARLTLRSIEAKGVDVLPRSRNVLAAPLTAPLLTIHAGQPLPFATSSSDGVRARFTAGGTRGTGALQAGAVQASITVYDSAGRVLASGIEVTCSVPTPRVTVATIRVV